MSSPAGRSLTALSCGVVVALCGATPAAADSTRDRQWHLATLEVARAHQISRGDGVIVAVIDSGVQADHQDLVGNVLAGVDLTGGDTKGREDVNGHGTAMAGLIAAHGHGARNADGVLGIAPAAKIFPVRYKREQVGSSAGLPEGIRRAVQGGAKVLSMSLTTGTSADLGQAIQEALAADVVVVAGVGNRPAGAFIGFPAAYPGVVAVGATGRDGRLAPVTITGEAMVLTAPGVDMASTSRTGAYQYATGTSDATAIVAGAAALVRSKYPRSSATEVVRRLTGTAADMGAPGRDPEYGYGALNLLAALTSDLPPGPPGVGPVPSADNPSQAAPTAATAPGDVQALPIRPSPAGYVAAGLLLLALLSALGAGVWLLVRGRRSAAKRVQPAGGVPILGHPASPAQLADDSHASGSSSKAPPAELRATPTTTIGETRTPDGMRDT